MPNKHAAIKDLRKNHKHAANNLRMKTHVKALTKQMKVLVAEGKKKEALEMTPKLQQAIAKASKKHVLHANKAKNSMSAVHKMVKKMA